MYILDLDNYKVIDSTNKEPGIYCLLNKKNNKKYVGSSINIYNRVFNQHINMLNSNEHYNKHLQRAYNKDKSYFLLLVLENVKDKEMLIEREQHWIDELKSYEYSYGYNLLKNAGSVLGFKHSEQTKEIIRKNKLNSSAESRKKMSDSHKIDIVQLNLDGSFVKYWESSTEAGKALCINSANISSCCTNKRNKAGGFLWMHKKNYLKANRQTI